MRGTRSFCSVFQSVDEAFPPATEAEIVDELYGESKAVPHPDLKKNKRETEKPDGPVGWLLDTGVDNTSHAAKIATLLKLTSAMGKDDCLKRYSNYRDLRDSGKTSEEAAKEVLGE